MDINLNIPFYDPEILEKTADRLEREIRNEDVIPHGENSGTLERTLHYKIHPEERRALIAVDMPYARYLNYGKLWVAQNGSAWAKKNERKHPTNRNLNFYHGENPNAKSHFFEYWGQGGKYEARAAQIYQEEWNKKYGGR